MAEEYSKTVERVKPSGLELTDRLVGVNRVTKVTKGGRAFGFSAIVVVGDGKGVVGHGLGKSKEVSEAIVKAIEDAKKNLIRVPLLGSTVPHAQEGKYGGDPRCAFQVERFFQPAQRGKSYVQCAFAVAQRRAGSSSSRNFGFESVQGVIFLKKEETTWHR